MKFLTLLTDAFGGRGGIAKYNRDLLEALCAYRGAEVIAIPRIVLDPILSTPRGLSFVVNAAQGKLRYSAHLFRNALANRFSAVICAHINLLPLAALVARGHGVPLVLTIHGIEVWKPHHHRLVRTLLPRVTAIASVSEFTKRRFSAWSGVDPEKIRIIPNTIDLEAYCPGPRDPQLAARFGLEGRAVVMTLGRLSRLERYKGIDEVLECIPTLVAQIPNLAYLVAGDGDDRPRLEEKARSLGIAKHVVFAGYVNESEKADFYRLADVFAMPSRGEGFGIVFLEAIACGVPVIASAADASVEALRNGRLGAIVDPSDRESIVAAIHQALVRPTIVDRSELHEYSYERFQERWHDLLHEVLEGTVLHEGATARQDTVGRASDRSPHSSIVRQISMRRAGGCQQP